MRKISNSDIRLGEPLPFSVYDTVGRLLLRKGFIITIPEHISSLVKRGIMMDENEGKPGYKNVTPLPAKREDLENQSPFEQASGLIMNLKHVFITFLKNPEQIDLDSKIKSIAADIQELIKKDVDGLLAAPYLDIVTPPIITHQFMGAVLTELILLKKEFSETTRLSYICAALTRDLGQIPFQNEIEKHNGPLSPELKKAIQQHTIYGRDILKGVGITDEIWLQSVYQHHERLDGSGYPENLKGEQISLGGHLLSVVDTYSAMVKPRLHRENKSFLPQNALRELYLNKDSLLDNELVQIMIKEVGIFVPGSLVRLKNNEIAAIKKRAFKTSEAIVYSIYDAKGMLRLSPLLRDLSNPEYEISGPVSLDDYRSASMIIKRLWVKN